MYFYPHFHAPFLSLSESALYPAKKMKSLTFPEINVLTLSFLGWAKMQNILFTHLCACFSVTAYRKTRMQSKKLCVRTKVLLLSVVPTSTATTSTASINIVLEYWLYASCCGKLFPYILPSNPFRNHLLR